MKVDKKEACTEQPQEVASVFSVGLAVLRLLAHRILLLAPLYQVAGEVLLADVVLGCELPVSSNGRSPCFQLLRIIGCLEGAHHLLAPLVPTLAVFFTKHLHPIFLLNLGDGHSP